MMEKLPAKNLKTPERPELSNQPEIPRTHGLVNPKEDPVLFKESIVSESFIL